MSKLLHWLAVLGSAYLALLILLWLLQGCCMIHFPTQAMVATPADAGLGYEELNLTTDDGEKLHAWFLPARDGSGAGSSQSRRRHYSFLSWPSTVRSGCGTA